MKKAYKNNKLHKLFRDMKKSRKKLFFSSLAIIKTCIKIFSQVEFNMPENKEDKKELKRYLDIYDECVAEIEAELISNIRSHLRGI